jgi:acetoin utilization deacetylase AcuC-like enzyme
MTTLLLTHPACLDHQPGPHHPERPERLSAILAALEDDSFAKLQRAEAPLATTEQLTRVHPADYVRAMLGAKPAPGEYAMIDGDTILSHGSLDAALRAAGAVVAGVDAVMTGKADTAFAAVRPPGHHATPDVPGGFCIFNNVAVGARHAQARHGIGKVAILDFDVHHGQGTQAVVEPDPSLFYGSTHQYPLYPGTGQSRERGIDQNVANVPLRPSSGSAQFRHAWGEIDRFGGLRRAQGRSAGPAQPRDRRLRLDQPRAARNRRPTRLGTAGLRAGGRLRPRRLGRSDGRSRARAYGRIKNARNR